MPTRSTKFQKLVPYFSDYFKLKKYLEFPKNKKEKIKIQFLTLPQELTRSL